MKTNTKKKIFLLVKLALGLLVLFFVVRQIDAPALIERFRRANLTWFGLASLATSLGICANAIRWNSITEHLQPAIGIRTALIGYFEGMFFNQVLPTGVGGDAVRGLRAYDVGLSAGLATLSVILDRAYGLLSVALIVVTAALFQLSAIGDTPIFSTLIVVSGCIVFGAAASVVLGAMITPERMPTWIRPIAWTAKGFSTCTLTLSPIFKIAVMLIVSNSLNVLTVVLCAKSVAVPLGFWTCVILTQALTLAAILPVSVGGWGVREGIAILLLAPVGIGSTDAAAISVMFGVVLTVNALLGAIVWGFNDYQRFGPSSTLPSVAITPDVSELSR